MLNDKERVMKKSMLKIISMSVLSAMILTSLTACGSKGTDAGSNGELYVYNWGEYIDEEVIEQFEEETGIKVIYDLFETNEEMYPVIEAGGVVYDVVCPSDYMIQKMIDNDMLSEINFDNVPNVKNIDDVYMEKSKAFDPENKYSVPYAWGTVGILYNSSMIPDSEAPKSWADLWDSKYAGEILMQDSVRDAFMVGEKMLGYDINTTNPDELNKVKDKLIEQKPLVQAYVVDQVRDKMIGGEAAIGVIYSGEILYIQGELEDSDADFELKYVLPEEGSNVWIDSWVIPKNAKNKENAEKWIDFLCRGDIAKKNFDYITYPTPNKAAYDMLDDDIKNNKAVFPDEKELSSCDVYQYLGEDGDELYNELWKEVKGE